MSESPPRRPFPARLIGSGARGARQVAGLAGLDRAAETAVEEALVSAAESPAVERALVRILEGPQFEQALGRALGQPAVERALARALDSEQFDKLWAQLLASDEAQRLVERIAEAPEVRAAVTAQGVGLIEDLGRQLRRVARQLDDGLERIARAILRRPQRAQSPKQAGLVTRTLAVALDAVILNGIFIVLSGAIALAVSLINGGGGELSTPEAALGFLGWMIAWACYLLFFWSLSGQTPGMRFLAISLDVHGVTAGRPSPIGAPAGRASGWRSSRSVRASSASSSRSDAEAFRIGSRTRRSLYVETRAPGRALVIGFRRASARLRARVLIGRRQATRFGGSEPARAASTFSATRRAIAARARAVAEPMCGSSTQRGASSSCGGDPRLALVDVQAGGADLVRPAGPRPARRSPPAGRGPC